MLRGPLNSDGRGLTSRIRAAVSNHFAEINERDKRWLMQLDIGTLNRLLWPLLVGFVCLNFLDVYTTTLAMNFGPLFHEENPIAAAFFDAQFQGYLLALAFKYLPTIPLVYISFVSDRSGRHALGIRMVKFAALVALGGADALLFYVVGINNLQSLLSVT